MKKIFSFKSAKNVYLENGEGHEGARAVYAFVDEVEPLYGRGQTQLLLGHIQHELEVERKRNKRRIIEVRETNGIFIFVENDQILYTRNAENMDAAVECFKNYYYYLSDATFVKGAK
jgi:hypothetical protein